MLNINELICKEKNGHELLILELPHPQSISTPLCYGGTLSTCQV